MKALMTATAVALIAGTAVAQDSYTFRMPSWMWEEGIVGDWNKDRVAAFEAANPGISVDKTLIPNTHYEQTLVTQIAAGDVPDFMPVFTNMLAPMIDAGILAPMDECIASSGLADRILPSVSFAQIDGKTYGVPLTMSPQSLLVNKQLLAAAGVEIPTNLDEFYAAAKAVKETTGEFGYGFPNDTASAIHVYINSMHWLIGMGSDWSQPDGTITANDESAVAAVSWIKRFLDEGLSPKGLGSKTVRQMFADGKVAMLFDGPWVVSTVKTINPDLVEHITFEVMPTPTHAAITGGAFYVIPKDSPHPDDACRMLNVFYDPAAQQRYLEDLVQIPGTIVEPSEAFLAEVPWAGTMAEIAAKYPGGIGYAPPGYEIQAAEFRQIVVDGLSRIYSGAMSVEEGLDNLQGQLENWTKTL